MKKNFFKLRRLVTAIVIGGIILITSFNTSTYAQTSSLTQGKVTLTFDDGLSSTYEYALPILKAKNIKATLFVPTNYIGQAGYMTWAQVKALQNTNGWEVGSHTQNHSELPLLSTTQIRNQLVRSKNVLLNRGINVTSFASPYGAYDNRVIIEAAKLYNLHRGFWDRDDLNGYPYDRSVIMVKSVETGVTVAQVKAWIDQAKAQNKWLVLVLHEVLPERSSDYEYTTTTDELTQIVEYISSSGIKAVEMNHSLQKPGINLLTNSSFNSGISQGWSTDSPTQIVANNGNNGSYPSSAQSIQLKGGLNPAHLYSNSVNKNAQVYSFEAFVNANALTVGEIGFYIDEYDSSNNWISGKWIGAVYDHSVKYFTARYTPTSSIVSTFKIQTYITSNSKGSVFVDNYQLYAL